MGDALLLAVGKNRRNLELIRDLLAKAGYDVLTCPALETCERMLVERPEILLALVDAAGFDDRIWQCCERLRQAGRPVLLVASRASAGAQCQALAHGACAVLSKPVPPRELLRAIHHLVGAPV